MWRFLAAAAALAGQGGDCPSLLERAQRTFALRQFAVAAAEFERALAVCPDRAAVLVPLAQVRYLLAQDAEAEAALLEAVRLQPSRTEARYALGRIYYQLNRFPAAVGEFHRTIALDPGNYRAHDNLALAYAALGQDADALRHFRLALDLVRRDHPDYDWVYGNLANFFLERSNYGQAFQFAVEAAQRNPGSARNCYLAGKSLVRLEKPDLSVRWLEQAVKLDPEHAEAFYLLSQVYRRVGRAGDSSDALEKFRALSKSPRPRR